MVIHGSCHCGNIGFELTWLPDPSEIPARACSCTFCAKHAGLWTSNPQGALRIVVLQASRVSRYSFGTQTAQFHICMHCGVVPVVTSEIDGCLYAVVSVHAFNNVDRSILRTVPASFEGESVESRLDRRKRNWVPAVQMVEGNG
jgi:hypothetical protein